MTGTEHKPDRGRHLPLLVACCLLIGYTAWARGGTTAAVQPPLGAFSLLIAILAARVLRPPHARRLARDPLMWIGVTFFCLLAVQTLNAGRYLYFNPSTAQWTYTAPPVPYLPWSFDRAESVQMFYWFAPPWILALMFRHVPDAAGLARRVLGFLVLNGTVLGLFGLVQQVSGSDSVYRFSESGPGAYYASFGYRNHAVAYLLPILALSLGYLGYLIRRRAFMADTRAPWAIWPAAGAALLIFIAIHPALSRAAILLAWTLVLAFIAGMLVRRNATNSVFRRRAPAVVVMALVLGMAAIWIAIFGGTSLARRFTESPPDLLVRNIETREWMWSAALRMWMDHPFWGVGGWGYRHLLPFYTEGAGLLEIHLPGKANAHNDALQFLAEFGTVGFGLLLAAAWVLAVSFAEAWRRAWGRPLSALFAAAAGGLFIVGLQSLFDLPFRNPAVWQVCAVLLAAVPAAVSRPYATDA